MGIPKLPLLSEEERTPIITTLLEIIHLQEEMIQQLRDEIAILKGQKPKSQIKPSQLEKGPKDKERENRKDTDGKRPGSEKRQKTKELIIYREEKIKPEHIPDGSIFKGYQEYVVQDIIIQSYNTKYLLERWQTPEGDYIIGKLPPEVCGTHFGPTLTSYILYQYYHGHVTQPLILEELEEFGVDISAGQVNRIITEGKEEFHTEKEEILRVGLEVSSYINVDDTSARHQGCNGYCTYIGNELFAWFESTESKSRINFLKLLRAGQWKEKLEALQITKDRHIGIATEGALLGSVLEHGFDPQMAIISDDAGQFNLFLHALCWVHTDRIIAKLIGYSDKQREALDETRSKVWKLYKDLKEYKTSPSGEKKSQLEARFDEIFTAQTCFVSLNQTLKRIHEKKAELLLVLDRPEIPLHNNLSENDIREYAKRRKVSGSTRSSSGRQCRDTFTSLKKTCRKLYVSFWALVNDRVRNKKAIPPLPDLIRLKAQESSS